MSQSITDHDFMLQLGSLAHDFIKEQLENILLTVPFNDYILHIKSF